VLLALEASFLHNAMIENELYNEPLDDTSGHYWFLSASTSVSSFRCR
jgi:hypothetical protein